MVAVPGFTLGAFVFLLRVSLVVSYPNGKVTKSCHRMIPEHGHRPQSDPTHRVAVNQTTFRPGDHIEGIVLEYFHYEFHTSTVYCIFITGFGLFHFNLFFIIVFVRFCNIVLIFCLLKMTIIFI